MSLVAIDPGLDDCGFAVFSLTGLTRTLYLGDARKRLVESGTWYTLAAEALADRLASLADRIAALIDLHSASVLVIERPKTSVIYRDREKGNDRAISGPMQKLALASGMLAGAGYTAIAAAGRTPRLLFADPPDAEIRNDRFLHALLPQLHRKTSEHERAALGLALNTLTDARRRWAA